MEPLYPLLTDRLDLFDQRRHARVLSDTQSRHFDQFARSIMRWDATEPIPRCSAISTSLPLSIRLVTLLVMVTSHAQSTTTAHEDVFKACDFRTVRLIIIILRDLLCRHSRLQFTVQHHPEQLLESSLS